MRYRLRKIAAVMAAAVAGYAFAPQGAKAQSLFDETYADGEPLDLGGDYGGGDASGPSRPRAPLPVGALELCERNRRGAEAELCACTSGVVDSPAAPAPGELVALVAQNKLMALYEHDEAAARFKPRCVFQGGIIRGSGI